MLQHVDVFVLTHNLILTGGSQLRIEGESIRRAVSLSALKRLSFPHTERFL